ncbi:tRNA (N6-threonylcarbamoyladenosine(37)-N6)-methyltransferase TrmO [Aerococcus urinaeequi]|uniref:tRNA (N6-threonylcarbamoyladenosine(37)-N6)-methyltransferase TrmO n=1 Tax=Aerococcus urinaeequi TaxID=51665 RepID=UPI003D6AD22C
MEVAPIGWIETAFVEKFGIPRQSMVVPQVKGMIQFYPLFNQIEYFKGIQSFDYLWLVWHFSAQKGRANKATVRPPRLGGNERVGVFASRSPYRPNPIGLSSVKLEKVHIDGDGKVSLEVSGVDLMDKTPILDIKPYVKTDIHEEARAGFTDDIAWQPLIVDMPEAVTAGLPEYLLTQLQAVLAQDPRPRTQDNPDKIYGMRFDAYDVHFTVKSGILRVVKITEQAES